MDELAQLRGLPEIGRVCADQFLLECAKEPEKVPGRCVVVGSLPLSANSKIDRAWLPGLLAR